MSRISDLILRQGDIRANRAAASGQAWGNLAQSLGEAPMRIGAMRQQQADADLRRQQVESGLETDKVQRAAAQGQIDAQAAAADEAAQARTLAAKTARVHGWLSELASIDDPAQRDRYYAEGRAALLQDGTLSPEDAPERYAGPSWVKSKLIVTGMAVDKIKLLMPDDPKPERLELQNPDGSKSIQFVAPKVGASFTSAPEPPKDFEWVTRGGKPLQIAKGTSQPGDRPYQPPSTAQPTEYKLVGPNGEQRIVRGADAANQLLAQGWKQYDATAVRQGDGSTSAGGAYAAERSRRALESVADLKSRVSNRVVGPGSMLANRTVDYLFGGDATNFAADLDALKSQIAFGELTEMREASKTGGALGSIAIRELELLESSLAGLTTKQTAANFSKNLDRVQATIQRWQAAKTGNAAPAAPGGRANGAGPGPAGSVSVTAPDGNTYTFPNQAQAEAFKRRAGIP